MTPAEQAALIIEEMADECCKDLPSDPFERRVAMASALGGMTASVEHLARLFGMTHVCEQIHAHRRPEPVLEHLYAQPRPTKRRAV